MSSFVQSLRRLSSRFKQSRFANLLNKQNKSICNSLEANYYKPFNDYSSYYGLISIASLNGYDYKFYYLLCPAVGAALSVPASDEKTNNDENKTEYKSWTGQWTLTIDDSRQLGIFLKSQKKKKYIYPSYIDNNWRARKKYRAYVARNNFIIDPNTINDDEIIIYKIKKEYYDNKGKLMNFTKASKIHKKWTNKQKNEDDDDNHDEECPVFYKETQVGIATEERLDDLWTDLHEKEGHEGLNGMISKLSSLFYIGKLVEWVKYKNARCKLCNDSKYKNKNKSNYRSPLYLRPTPSQPWSYWCVDLCGGFTTS